MTKHNGVNWARTYNSLTFLDKDDEYIMNQLSNISGLSQLLETNMWLVAAALEMQGVLFGDLKGGLSQESDAFHRYCVTIMNRCDSYYRPVLQKLLYVIFLMHGIDEMPDFEFRPLDQDEINAARTTAIQNYGNMLETLTGQGVISKYQAAVSLQNFINNNSVNIDFSELQMNKLKFEEEAEILVAYKTAGKAAPSEILGEQFPGEQNPFAGRYTPATGTEYRETSEPLSPEEQPSEAAVGEPNETVEG